MGVADILVMQLGTYHEQRTRQPYFKVDQTLWLLISLDLSSLPRGVYAVPPWFRNRACVAVIQDLAYASMLAHTFVILSLVLVREINRLAEPV